MAALVVLMPLMRRTGEEATGYEQDVAVYKDQIREIDRDLARGVLPEEEADAARAEIARRLLAADTQQEEQKIMRQGRTQWAALFAVVVIPAVALATYLSIGQPGLPDQPLQARLNKPLEQQTIPEMIARVESHLKENPNDGQGWEILGPVYMRVGRVDDAINAYRKSVALLGETPVSRLESWAEAIVVRDRGAVNQEARTIFERAVTVEPSTVKARFYLAMQKQQTGDKDGAISAWSALIESAKDPAAPWVSVAQRELSALEGNAPAETPAGTSEAPAGQVTAEQNEMIASMVTSLATRLQDEGGSVEEWGQLMRSYTVLEQRESAMQALKDAREAYAGDEAGLKQIAQIASALGLAE